MPTGVCTIRRKLPVAPPNSGSPAVRQRSANELSLAAPPAASAGSRSEEHTSELQSRSDLVCRLLLEKKKVVRAQEIERLTKDRGIAMVHDSRAKDYAALRKTLHGFIGRPKQIDAAIAGAEPAGLPRH